MTSERAFVGTYTDGNSDGIYACTVDVGSDPVLSRTGGATVAENPSFLALHPTEDRLYAVHETAAGRASAFRFAGGDLQALNRVESGAAGPCHCHVHPSGDYLLVAHYTGGAVSVLPIDDDGELREPSTVVHHEGASVHPERQTEPHPHSITPGPNGRFVYVPDLGTDEVVVYEFDERDGSLEAVSTADVEAGSGPRHLSFHPTERLVFLINELDSTVTAFRWDRETGGLETVDRKSTVPPNADGYNATADVHVHPSGRYLYGSNRGHDSIAIFAVDEQTGELDVVGHEGTRGEWPRHFTLDGTGEYLFVENQHSDSIVAFRVDADSGRLTATGETVSVPDPVCMMLPS